MRASGAVRPRTALRRLGRSVRGSDDAVEPGAAKSPAGSTLRGESGGRRAVPRPTRARQCGEPRGAVEGRSVKKRATRSATSSGRSRTTQWSDSVMVRNRLPSMVAANSVAVQGSSPCRARRRRPERVRRQGRRRSPGDLPAPGTPSPQHAGSGTARAGASGVHSAAPTPCGGPCGPGRGTSAPRRPGSRRPRGHRPSAGPRLVASGRVGCRRCGTARRRGSAGRCGPGCAERTGGRSRCRRSTRRD